MHLQALIGGEEVIVAESDSVDGIDTIGALDAAPLPPLSTPPNLPELAGLVGLSSPTGQALLAASNLQNLHAALIDETVTSAAFVVSWHDPHRPVQLNLVTPSLSVVTPSSASAITTVGSSHIVMRIDSPEPGEWQIRVNAADVKGRVGYTWGVHATTPLGLRLTPPLKPLGQTKLTVTAHLDDPSGIARGARIGGRAAIPTISVNDLINKNRAALDQIKLPLEPDTPAIDPNLTKLPVLDLQLVTKGEPSLFASDAQKLAFTGRGTKRASYEAPVPGTTALDLQVSGTTTGGLRFTRRARCDVHS